MANPYPIPREARATGVLSGDGGATYGPFGFKIFDTADVEVITKPDGAEGFSVAAVTVAKVSSAALEHFTITFPAAVPATTKFQVRGRRVHERSAGVQSGTKLSPDALERELSKQAVTLEELRRDAPDIDPDIEDGQAIILKGGRLGGGPAASLMEAIPGLAAQVAANAAQTAADVVTTNENVVITNANKVQTGLDRAAAAASKTQAELAAIAAGAKLYGSVAEGLAATTDGDIFLIPRGPGVQVYLNDAGAEDDLGWLGEILFDDAATLFSDTNGFPDSTILRTREEGYAYKVAAPGATGSQIVIRPDGLKLYVLPVGDTLNLMAFGARGDDVADDRSEILNAIDAAVALGGARIITQPGARHRYSGRILLRPGVTIDFGKDNQIDGARLVAMDDDGGIDLVAGSHIRATLRTSAGAGFTGPMLDVNDAKNADAGNAGFGRNERQSSFDVDMRGDRQLGSSGLRLYSSTSAGVSWVRGAVTCGEMDFPFTIETAASGYVNENEIDVVAYDGTEYVRGINNGNEIAANRIRATCQTSTLPRFTKALNWDGVGNTIEIKVWDINEDNIGPAFDGIAIQLTGKSGANTVDGFLSRSLGFERDLVVDLAPTTRRNWVNLRDKRVTPPINRATLPSSGGLMVGDQDDMLAYATLRHTVSAGGSTPVDATSLRRLFEPTATALTVNDVSDFEITVDLGSARSVTEMKAMGIRFLAVQDTPDRIKIDVSGDGVSWTRRMEHGLNGEPFPLELNRIDGSGFGARYLRMIVENDVPRRVRIVRWYAMDELFGDGRILGAYAPIKDPYFYGQVKIDTDVGGGGLYVGGDRVVKSRQPAVADVPVGGAATTDANAAAINSILSRLRQHGLIAT